MRGFVITILSVTFIGMLLVLSISLRNAQLGTERALIEPLSLTYASFLLDDVGYEFNSILGPRIGLDERNDSMVIALSDTLHDANHSTDIYLYKAFMEGSVSGATASNISLNITNLTSGTIRLFINEDYNYTNDHSINESFFTKDNGTGATSYSINITVSGARTNITHMAFNDSGTINVTIMYSDLNGTGVESGKVFPNQQSAFRLDYGSNSMVVTLGSINGNSGSLRMKSTGIRADTSWTAVLPRQNPAKRVGIEYDAAISYSQGKVRKAGRIGK
jgi:hypothetical protein